jgi:hypothetical protein
LCRAYHVLFFPLCSAIARADRCLKDQERRRGRQGENRTAREEQ